MNTDDIKNHDVQSVYIGVAADEVFDFIADPNNLPKWTSAFKEADESSALLATPDGELRIGLETEIDKARGTVDWLMKMPDGNIGAAYSRVVPASDGKAIYSFILLAPPAALEEIEGILARQIEILRHELQTLQTLFPKTDG